MLDSPLRALAKQMAKVSTEAMSIIKKFLSGFFYHPLTMAFLYIVWMAQVTLLWWIYFIYL